jgi:3-phenylpropionate/trans-cinnamate dioxygenase ferredoxin subunit
MSKYVVGTTAEIAPGQRKIVEVGGISIGVFNVGGTYYALRNRCPHQGAPLCQGSLKGTALPSLPGEYVWAREGEILRCPWHGWEFDVTTGRSICNPHRIRVRAYEVTVEAASDEDPTIETFRVTTEAGNVVLHLRSRREPAQPSA